MKTVIEMAREAGFAERDSMCRVVFVANKYDLEKFASLIEAAARADEREECAKLADIAEPYQSADLIRARGTI